ncbi:hypothetical protein H312_01836 [Anncaliia algerae PRA339]|uniref:Uncharacterized protein n=1 Tax=Anncaliia algerae PRA339 TaxID=1288291 RepID=A0A059F0U8_9MICR|nr:hypothetical protein H312_01836 [Anncaliia algerae PRA339]
MTFPPIIPCNKCFISEMAIKQYSQALKGLCYRCKNPDCKQRKAISFGSAFKGLKFNCKIILRAIYCFVRSYNNFQAVNQLDINEKSFIKIKNLINSKIKEF